MSDQQKGLIQAVSEIWNQAEVRCYARHVYCNFRDVFGGGQELRKWFWRIDKSTTEIFFQAYIEAFRKVSEAAANDLLNRNYKKWCKAFYTPQSCFDSIDNNMSEVFNAYTLNSRHKPIITMLEDISETLMERLFKKRDFIEKKECFICPRIQQKLEDNKLKSRGWSAFRDGRFKFGVRDGITQTKYVVDLRDRTCSCNTCQLSGIPCKHAISAIWKSVEHPKQYVASSFTKPEYLKAYDFPMEPLNGPNEWPISQIESISSPPLKKGPSDERVSQVDVQLRADNEDGLSVVFVGTLFVFGL
ncbi:uncharacterized protein LOC110692207 [Chenopodium quinoa]|uniref:uncharacterized protein LOC110692207 n=1 Tax=Chenopodium quinoa TaxID=63459 RepID=UPI000B779109|nr:uncharacterized protein LOC110692207 [Chenopodium quinoa]